MITLVQFHPQLLLATAITALLFFLLAMQFDPQRPLSKSMNRLALGAMTILAWNALAKPHLNLNPLSATITGFLGLPGVLLTALLQFIAQQV